jgi:predicted DNA binding CopG/RHH family protein
MKKIFGGDFMRDEYDFSQARENPFAKRLKKQITINLDNDTINYFKAQSSQSGIPYQTLINLYLSDCATQKRQVQVKWG